MSIENRFKSQFIKTKNGVSLSRRYVYMEESTWLKLDAAALKAGMTLSVFIEYILKLPTVEIFNDSNSKT